jgi:predicted PurR-regulated permease PerM
MVKFVRRYWGYLIIFALVVAWSRPTAAPVLIVVLSAVALAYLLFQAPGWCGAVTRDDTLCRQNARGILMGCSLRQHKWQKLKMTFVPRSWRALNRGLWSNPKEAINTAVAVVTILSGIAGVITAIVT